MGNSDLIARREAVTPRGIPMVYVRDRRLGQRCDCWSIWKGREADRFCRRHRRHERRTLPASGVEAIREQGGKLLHTCIHVATYEPYIALCEKLVELLPHGERTKVMLVNSGAEAVENAVKIARQATNRPRSSATPTGFMAAR